MELAVETGIPPHALRDLDADELSTLVDVLNDRAKKRKKQ